LTKLRPTLLLLFCVPLGYLAEIAPRWDGPHGHMYGDCPYYRQTIVSLLGDGDLDLRNNYPAPGLDAALNVSLGQHGEWYPKGPLLLPLVSLPFYALGGDVGLLLFNVVELTALVLLLFVCARRYASELVALAVTFWYAFGTLLRPVGYNYSPDVLSTLIVVGAFYALVTERPAWAGTLLGLAAWAKWTNVLLLPIVAVYLLTKWRWSQIGRLAMAAAGPLLALGILNWHMFGSPLLTPFDRVVRTLPDIVEPSHRTFFDVPLWSGLWTQLSDGRVGLFVSAPPIVLAPAGLTLLYRKSRSEALLVAAFCLALIFFFAPYRLWYLSNFGHRFLMTVVVLSAIPVAALFDRVLRHE
jgi:hypothetical protein